MKKRSPNLLFMLLLLSSILVFSYINFCPSVSDSALVSSGNLVEVSKDMVSLPEFEIVINTLKAVIDFIRP